MMQWLVNITSFFSFFDKILNISWCRIYVHRIYRSWRSTEICFSRQCEPLTRTSVYFCGRFSGKFVIFSLKQMNHMKFSINTSK